MLDPRGQETEGQFKKGLKLKVSLAGCGALGTRTGGRGEGQIYGGIIKGSGLEWIVHDTGKNFLLWLLGSVEGAQPHVSVIDTCT